MSSEVVVVEPGSDSGLPSTKKLIGILAVFGLIALGVAWVALAIRGVPAWINILLVLTALIFIAVIVWLFFSA